jgi:peptidoglycan/LPS O-acetylase OafA/YrhL
MKFNSIQILRAKFLLGVMICHFLLHIKSIPSFVGSALLITGIVAYLLMIILGFGKVWHFQSTLSGEQSFNRFLYWGIPSSFIVAGSVILEKEGKLKHLWSNKVFLFAGDASYSIYLIHLYVLNLCLILFLKTGAFMPPDAMIWALIEIAVSISLVFYQLVEKPLLQHMYRSYVWNILFTRKEKKESRAVTKLINPPTANFINKKLIQCSSAPPSSKLFLYSTSFFSFIQVFPK